MKIIFLNGPPRSGKDFTGGLICRSVRYLASCDKFARVLKERTHALYGMPGVEHDGFELAKDENLPCFLGQTPRKCYIAVSEQLMKPLHGSAIFGRLLLEDLWLYPDDLVCITDSGFRTEAVPIIEWAGAANCTLVRLHREGCSFEGDSRAYIDLADLGVRCVDVTNPGNPEGLKAALNEAGVL